MSSLFILFIFVSVNSENTSSCWEV